PVIFTAGQPIVSIPNNGFVTPRGLAGLSGRSQPHVSSAAATRPGTKPSVICLHMLPPRRVHSRTTARGVTARQMPLAGLRQSLVVSRDTCTVAAVQRGAHIRCGASVVAATLERARHTCDGGSGGVATSYGAPRGAACGPLPAGRCIAHSPTSSVTHTRDVSHVVSHALRSARAQRLRDGHCPSRRVCRRCQRAIQLEALAIA